MKLLAILSKDYPEGHKVTTARRVASGNWKDYQIGRCLAKAIEIQNLSDLTRLAKKFQSDVKLRYQSVILYDLQARQVLFQKGLNFELEDGWTVSSDADYCILMDEGPLGKLFQLPQDTHPRETHNRRVRITTPPKKFLVGPLQLEHWRPLVGQTGKVYNPEDQYHSDIKRGMYPIRLDARIYGVYSIVSGIASDVEPFYCPKEMLEFLPDEAASASQVSCHCSPHDLLMKGCLCQKS